ncbi:MAG: PEP-utilizing enzyme, partial [Erysipelotrichaceae bacterium]|nr:PEP-utilizing enzyme [Erysipelotrichaceae bacterium]
AKDVEGCVVVVEPGKEVDVKDKIIVAKMTDPGWVFLLTQCKGIIVEKGSLLSHTAIISRELKIPAIVAVEGVMEVLKDGDYVALDSKNGIVKIIARS